ncbi:MAG: hypothetical protein AB7O43_02125 [Hyphomicrobiaceae bacterium]
MVRKSDGQRGVVGPGASERAELILLLETWGGEQGRWPAPAVARLTELRRSVPEAARLIAEAHALDQTLDAVAKSVPADAAALADRIMAAAMASEAPRTSARVIRLPVRKVGSSPSAARVPVLLPRPARWQQAATLMAACLMAGILVGGSFDIAPALRDYAGLPTASTAEFEAASLVFGEDGTGEDAQ